MKRLPFCLTPSPAIFRGDNVETISQFKESHLQVVSMLEHLCTDETLGCASDLKRN